MKTFTIYTDPGHGWLKVPIAIIDSLGIGHKISAYSYMRKDYAYLEEDCDMGAFMIAFRDKHGNDPVIREANRREGYSKIRSYARFTYYPRIGV